MATTSMTQPADITRDLGSVLSRAEKRLLVFLAKRMPKAVSSDHLTVLGHDQPSRTARRILIMTGRAAELIHE